MMLILSTEKAIDSAHRYPGVNPLMCSGEQAHIRTRDVGSQQRYRQEFHLALASVDENCGDEKVQDIAQVEKTDTSKSSA